jgi:type IV secretory pathway protease TraF
VWVAADYHFPSTYSCRILMSSMSSAPVMPAPGPATVRLALIKAGIECFGLDAVRDEFFPILRSAPVLVRPPRRVAISQHLLRGYKWNEEKANRRIIQESLIVGQNARR